MSGWNLGEVIKGFLSRTERTNRPDFHYFFLPFTAIPDKNLLYSDTNRSTNSCQRFSHGDSALFFSVPSSVEN